MKNTNKKGFTLVELVIVIAVIAILAGVLIGTFATVISRANQNSALQRWKAAVDESYVNYVADKHTSPTFVKIDASSVTFGDGSENSADFKSLDLYERTTIAPVAPATEETYTYAKSNTKMFFVLDKEHNVYLLVNNAADSVSYSVVATNDTLTDASLTDLYSAASQTTNTEIKYSETAVSGYKTLTYGGTPYSGSVAE